MQCVDGSILEQLDEEDLILLPMHPPSHRKYVLRRIQEYKDKVAKMEKRNTRRGRTVWSPEDRAKERVKEWMRENEVFLSP